MAQPLNTSLIYEILKDVQARLARLDGMRDEMREGFASIRAHMATQHADAAFPERRAERDMARVRCRLELIDEPEKA